jgi:hypothetical protein
VTVTAYDPGSSARPSGTVVVVRKPSLSGSTAPSGAVPSRRVPRWTETDPLGAVAPASVVKSRTVYVAASPYEDAS